MSEHEPQRDPVEELFSRARAEVANLPADDVRWQRVVATARARRRGTGLRYAVAAAAVAVLAGGALWAGLGGRPTAAPPASTPSTGTAQPGPPSGGPATAPTTAPATTAVAAGTPVLGGPVPGGFAALSMSNAGHGTIYVLGTGDCGSGRGRCPVLVRSTDDGTSWATVHAFPDHEPASPDSADHQIQPGTVLSQVRFANPEVGWVFGGAEEVTRDGGRTWAPVPRTGESVVDLETDGQVAYTVSGQDCAPGTCAGRLALGSEQVSGAAPGDHRVLGTRTPGMWSQAEVALLAGKPVVGVQADTGLALRPAGDGSLRAGTPLPACHDAGPAFITTDAATQRTLLGLCSAQGTAGSIGYAVATSADGATWQTVSTDGLLLVDAGNVTFAAAAPTDLLVASGGSPDVHGAMKVSHDGGRTWSTPKGAPPLPARGWRWVGAPGGSQYYALAGDGPLYWVSDDLGEHWHKVAIS